MEVAVVAMKSRHTERLLNDAACWDYENKKPHSQMRGVWREKSRVFIVERHYFW